MSSNRSEVQLNCFGFCECKMTGGYCFDKYNKECGYFLPPADTFMTSNIRDDKYFCKCENTGCPKKNALLRLTGHRGHQEWTRDKSRVSFAKFRKFPF